MPVILFIFSKRNKYSNFHLLEKILIIFVSKKWHGIREHPNVTTTTIVVWFTPFAIFVSHR